MGVCLPEGGERTLENMELGEFENKGQYALERYNDDFYKLTRRFLSCNKPGTYEIGLGIWEWFIYDEDGKEIADELLEQGIFAEYDFDTGEWYIAKEENGEISRCESNYKLEIVPGKLYEAYPTVTVTVTGSAVTSTDDTSTSVTGFPDVKAAAWYADAVVFASASGYMNGNADGTFNPAGTAKRSETAQILMNFFG